MRSYGGLIIALSMAWSMSAAGLNRSDSVDPLYQATGDHQRSHRFTEGGMASPYLCYSLDRQGFRYFLLTSNHAPV